MPDLPWQEEGTAVVVRLCIQPRASRNGWNGLHNGELKLQLTAPPVDGAANEACRAFLAKQFGVAKASIRLLSGETSRHKRLRIEGVSVRQVEQLCSIS